MWTNARINIKYHKKGEKYLDIYIQLEHHTYCFTIFKNKEKKLYKVVKQEAKKEGII